jgi:hypothetical protein
LRALGREFLDEPAVNLSRPVESELVAERAVFDGGDAGIFHRNKGKIGRGRRGKTQSQPRAQVVSEAFQSVKKVQAQQANAADEHEDEDGYDYGRTFERLEFHRTGLNKKPEQLKAALVLIIAIKSIKNHSLRTEG